MGGAFRQVHRDSYAKQVIPQWRVLGERDSHAWIQVNVFQAEATAHVLLWEELGLLKLSTSGVLRRRDREVERRCWKGRWHGDLLSRSRSLDFILSAEENHRDFEMGLGGGDIRNWCFQRWLWFLSEERWWRITAEKQGNTGKLLR